MDQRALTRLAAADLDPSTYRELAAHGEDLIVERKVRFPEPEKLGAVIASMANILGGWLLIGVRDRSGEFVPVELPKGDLQSTLGSRLHNVLDPVPPFLAGALQVDGIQQAFVRVFPASGVILTKQGVVYTRSAAGKRPVADHRELLEMTERGRRAESDARRRLEDDELANQVLGLPVEKHVRPENMMKTIIRATPLTVTAPLVEWPISAGPNFCRQTASRLASVGVGPGADVSDVVVEPFGRGVAARAGFPNQMRAGPLAMAHGTTFAGCNGVFGAVMLRMLNNVLSSSEMRSRHIRPAIDAVADLLEHAEAFGEARVELDLVLGRELSLRHENSRFDEHKVPDHVHCEAASLEIPADDEARNELGRRWEREVAREAGVPMWQGEDSS